MEKLIEITGSLDDLEFLNSYNTLIDKNPLIGIPKDKKINEITYCIGENILLKELFNDDYKNGYSKILLPKRKYDRKTIEISKIELYDKNKTYDSILENCENYIINKNYTGYISKTTYILWASMLDCVLDLRIDFNNNYKCISIIPEIRFNMNRPIYYKKLINISENFLNELNIKFTIKFQLISKKEGRK